MGIFWSSRRTWWLLLTLKYVYNRLKETKHGLEQEEHLHVQLDRTAQLPSQVTLQTVWIQMGLMGWVLMWSVFGWVEIGYIS